jgi:hypothetical protein
VDLDREPDSLVLRGVFERLDLDRVVRRVCEGLDKLPAANEFAWPIEPITAVRWNVELIVRWLVNGTAPDQYQLAELRERLREHAAAGQSIQNAILVYRRGTRLLSDALLQDVDEDDRAALEAETESINDHLERFLDIVVKALARVYADELDLPVAAGELRARTPFHRLCAGLPLTVEDRERTLRLGIGPGPACCPFSARLIGGSAATHARLAARLRDAHALAFTDGAHVTGLTDPAFTWSTALADRRVVLATAPATPRTQLAAEASRLATVTEIAARAGRTGWVSTDDFVPELLLADSPLIADRIVRRVLGGLADGAGELAVTLRSLAAHSFDGAKTAAALPVHRNTLLYRTARIEQLTGLDLRRDHDRVLVALAVRWERDGAPLAPGGNGESPGPGVRP